MTLDAQVTLDETSPVCILGAGPAGLQLAYFLSKANHPYVVLERGESPGTFFKSFPRHRKLISVNKVYTGHDDQELNYRWDWNSLICDEPKLLFRNYSRKYFPPAEDLVQYLQDFANHYALNIVYGVEIEQVTKTGEQFQLRAQDGRSWIGSPLVIATGVSKPYVPMIPGIELAEQYVDVSIDPDDFVNQRVLIIGKGNSAFETADNLIDTAAVIHVASPKPVKFAWQSHFVGNLRAVNNNLLDTYLLKCQNATLEVEITKIEKCDDRFAVHVCYQRANQSTDVIPYDRIICCTGFRFDHAIFDHTCRPELMIRDRFPKLDSAWQSTNVPGLYFAGTLMQSRDFKKTSSGFIHGFRYNVRTLASILLERYAGTPLPYREVQSEPEQMVNAILDRVNRSSALWQQFSFLADVIVPDPQAACLRYYEALPVDYAHDFPIADQSEYFTITLEYGFGEDDDPFRSERVAHTDAKNAADSTFLHPIVRHYRGGQMVEECHLVENLEANWNDPELHVRPLFEFCSRKLASRFELANGSGSLAGNHNMIDDLNSDQLCGGV